jgi:hypothetical protein
MNPFLSVQLVFLLVACKARSFGVIAGVRSYLEYIVGFIRVLRLLSFQYLFSIESKFYHSYLFTMSRRRCQSRLVAFVPCLMVRCVLNHRYQFPLSDLVSELLLG